MYCLIKPDLDARERLLEAVNLGKDTDITAAVLGGLLGIRETVPEDLFAGLRSKEIIEDAAESVYAEVGGH